MRRIVLALALAACASPAFAVQDRYGPPQAQTSASVHATPVSTGPLLDWAGKAAPPAATFQPAAPQRPAPIAPWAQKLAPPAAQPVVVQSSQARVLPPPPAVGRPMLYVARPVSAAAAPVAPPRPTALAPNAAERPRVYSVGRQYGAQPDPIPVAAAAPSGPALTLNEIPTSENLGRSQAPLDDGRANQAVAIPDTKQNAASNRISRYGL